MRTQIQWTLSAVAIVILRLFSPNLHGAPGAVDFNREIRPILSDNCYHCHGPDQKARKANLRVDRREGVLEENAEGYAIVVPGKPDESELILRIFSDDPEEIMPQPDSHRTLTPEQKDLLKRWVQQGAPWAEHWAFVAPVRPVVPSSASFGVDALVRNPIDAFVLARLAQEKLAPSPEASREKLIRRVTLDLTGLPPTPREIDAFLADTSPAAYERLVDRLLASVRFGERMVWDWLDVARYADTNGFQGDPTRTMWPWRDWVINALNTNMPYDQFTIEQIAGDLLPEPTRDQKIATGFHRNHMLNNEGGSIPEESRVSYVFDRVETTATVFLGLTLGCARCHDHKFDPFTQREYYQFYAYFNQLPEKGNADAMPNANPVMSLAAPEDEARAAALKTAESAIRSERLAIEESLKPQRAAWEKAILDGTLPLPKPEASALAPGNASLPPAEVSDNLRAILLQPADQRSPEDAKIVTDLYHSSSAEHRASTAREAEAKRIATDADRALLRVMIMADMPTPRETHILTRGSYDQPTTRVTPGTPSILPALPPDAPANRMALARWLVSPENPLTARVTVNRLWTTFFGRGIVKTPSDFGVQGDKPTQPELLDWLAREFVDSGWNVKGLIRLIITSATYRQSSRIPAALLERDPDNHLLARGPRFRMPSWMIRDTALAAGGLLVEKLGGAPVKGYQPPGIWEEATFGKITYAQDTGAALYRRSLYHFWRRIVGPTLFFDTANRQNCSVESTRTNTPLHALTTLNDVTYVEAARSLAERVFKEGGDNDQTRLGFAFRVCTSRFPSAGETAQLRRALDRQRELFAKNLDAARELIANGDSKPDAALDPVELAAHTAVALLLLNLDECLSKE